jgi:hypothetical protein
VVVEDVLVGLVELADDVEDALSDFRDLLQTNNLLRT